MGLTNVIDYHHDTSKQLFYKITKNYTTPDYVKTAALETAETLVGLPVDYYIDKARLRFPCHTKSATWLAGAYILENYDAYTQKERDLILGNLVKKARSFNIENDIADIFEKKASVIQANSSVTYALTPQATGKDLNLLPINTKENIVKSAELLQKNPSKFTFEMRKTASRNILDAAVLKNALIPATVTTTLIKSAGYTSNSTENIKKELLSRIYMVNRPNTKQACVKLAKISLALPTVINVNDLSKLAHVIESYDLMNNLTHLYGKIKTPEEICFATVFEKKANMDTEIVLKDGTTTDAKSIMQVDLNDIKAALGNKVASAFAPGGVYDEEEISLIAPSLPLDDAKVLSALIPG